MEKLRNLRKERNIPVTQIASLLKINTQTYYKKETKTLRFSLEDARIISKLFDMTIEDIFFNDECANLEQTA